MANEFDEKSEDKATDREAESESIRQRIRNAKVGDNATFIPAKPSPTIHDEGHKRVAVYTRVSTNSLDQVSSIENQAKYYTEKVEKNPNWELQEIYSDEGKSGTSMRKRVEFQRMLKDAIVDKKMDVILCASVSRFARNMSDCMEQVRELKTANPSNPIGVYFETENIFTLDPDSGQALAVHAMLADWESANKSRRMILSYDQRICTGQYPVSDLLGYRHTKDGQLIMEPEEAKTVRLIFLGRLALLSYKEIAQILTEKKRPTLTGRTEWNESMVSGILENERRWGDLNARKTIVIDYVKGKSIKNDRIRDAAYVTDHHEGIVSPDIARAVKFIGGSHGLNGMPEIRVVTQGALKGFVNVNPGWAGIDESALMDACKGVYSEEAFEALTKIPEPTEERMPGYEVAPGIYFMNQNTPALTITDRKISFNAKCHERLDRCDRIEVLYHPMLHMFAIMPCDADSPNATSWVSESGNRKDSIAARKFCGAMYSIMHWNRDLKFKFRGVTKERNGFKIMFFLLDEPRIYPKKGTAATATTDDAISYMSPEEPYTYPTEWKFTIGITPEIKRRRDFIFDNISVEDITAEPITITNPLVGDIPSGAEIIAELEELIMSM